MNVLQSLTELYNSQGMDSIYRELASRILENLDHMRRVTIYDIADLTNSSRTTVWRLVQKLGYSSFSDFRYALQSAASQYHYYNRMVDQRHNNSTEQLVKNLKTQFNEVMTIIRDAEVSLEIEEIINELSDADKICFFLHFRSAFVYSFQQNIWKDGKKCEYQCLMPDMLETAEQLTENSVVFFSTIEYAETQDYSTVFEKVKTKGARIWLFGGANSHFRKFADRILLPVKGEPATGLFAMESYLLLLNERYRGKYIDQ